MIVVTAINQAMLFILPSFVGALGEDFQLPPDKLGLLASADLIGIAVSTASAPLWLRQVRWRRTVVAALIALLLTNVVCFSVVSFAPLMALRFLTGVIAGVGYSLGLAGIMDTRRPDRNAGLLVVVGTLFSALGLYLIDSFAAGFRLHVVYVYILVWTAPSIVLAWLFFPDEPGERSQRISTIDRGSLALRGGAVILAAGIYYLMIGSVWGHLEGIAREAGLTLVETGRALSFGLVVSLLGGAAAAALGLRLGRVPPLLVGGLLQLASLLLLTRLQNFHHPIVAFCAVNAIFQLVWTFVVPYFMILFAQIEPTGRFISMYGAVTHLTLAIGPYAGAGFISGGHYRALLWFGTALVFVCYGLFIMTACLDRAGKSKASGISQPAESPVSGR